MKSSLAIRYTVLMATIGIVVTSLVGYVMTSSRNTNNRNIPYLKLVDYLQNSTTKAHLLFNDVMNGDASIDYQKDVVKLLSESKKALGGFLEGDETVLGKFQGIDDEETKAIAKESLIALENFMLATNKRWQARNYQPVVEAVDDSTITETIEDPTIKLEQEIDATYGEVQVAFDNLSKHLAKRVEVKTSLLVFESWLAVVFILGIFLLLSFFVYRIISRNEKLSVEGRIKLKEEKKRVETLSNFIESVSTGNYAIEIGATDELSNKLLRMRDSLRTNAEDDQRRNWATSGLAQIGEILRASDDTSQLYDSIIKFVVKYLKINQGGLFLLNDDNENDQYLELVSCYAFERKKFIQKRVDPGQGLIGQCYLEGSRIYLKEIPKEYTHITSGLGGSAPKSLLVIPMNVNDKTYGVIELASFKKFDEHEIVLVEKFAENIGAAVSSVKINASTRILLEKTQQQTEEMRSQEEEMRQNMEELSATQEEMVRKEREYISRIQELESRAGIMASLT